MNKKQEVLKNLPAVDKLLLLPEVKKLLAIFGKDSIIFCIRFALNTFRENIQKGSPPPSQTEIIEKINELINLISKKSLKKVINGTGIIIHTNLGRAPFNTDFIKESVEVLNGYNNLEFDLNNGKRGSRNVHAYEILKYLIGAEDILIVNNAAAAVMLILRTFAKRKEVLVSRGELIEIGGSFRIPDIMKASDCKMVEVGTTNKTKKEDFLNAITRKTALIFKAHKSNYVIKGFTEEVSLQVLTEIGKNNQIPIVYDLGSGLLRNNIHPVFKGEPSASEAILQGVDILCFSGDKLLGGPQAGIIAGRKDLITKLKKEPMLRALRVCKTTLAMLETVCKYHLDEDVLKEKCLIYKILFRKPEEIKQTANKLKEILTKYGIETEVLPSKGLCGGGTMPEGEIDSFAVLIITNGTRKESEEFAEQMYSKLLLQTNPVLSILKKGKLFLDALTIFEDEFEEICQIIGKVWTEEKEKNNI